MNDLHLFLSPHFDDAIGSCGGTITRLLAQGARVCIVTVFGGPERLPFSFPAEVLHEEWGLESPVAHRRSEDEAACRILGCERTVLDFSDAIYRQAADGRHLYPTFESLRDTIAAGDQQLPTQIASRVEASVESGATVIYHPLGIGAHVDHIITRDSGRLLARRHPVVSFRDFVYDRTWDGHVDEAAGRRIEVALTDCELDAKRTAFAAYGSQIADLFAGKKGMDDYFQTMGRRESLFVADATSASIQAVLAALLV